MKFQNEKMVLEKISTLWIGCEISMKRAEPYSREWLWCWVNQLKPDDDNRGVK